MRKFSILFIVSLSVAAASLSAAFVFAADEPDVSIEKLMSAEELEASGVADLSSAQLDALNAWLRKFARGEAGAAVLAAPVVSSVQSEPAAVDTASAAQPVDEYPPRANRDEIHSRIAGEFNGWTGETLFRLENGQIWQQRKGFRWNISLDSPEVRIYKNFTGAYEMEVVSEGRSVGVRRLR